MPERFPSPDFSEPEQRLIALLREKGPNDPDVRAIFDAWCGQEEARAMALNTSRANIEVQLRRAKLYRAAGGYDSAWDTLAALCMYEAPDESAKDLYREAMALAEQMRRELGG